MTVTVVIKKITTLASSSKTAFLRVGRPVWRTLTFSPADDVISPKKSLCVSIEKGGLYIALGLRFLSKIRIKGLRRYLLKEDTYSEPEGFASSVALAINDLGAVRTDVTLIIPKAWAIIKTAEFPSTVKENLLNVISYELDRLTPFNPEDAFYDFRILREDAEKLTLLVIAAKAGMIKPYLDALAERGINVNRVTVNLSGIGTLCHYTDREKDSLFIAINRNEYEGALFLGGSVMDAFTGSFSTSPISPLVRGAGGGFEKPKGDTILKEIEPLIDAVKKQGRSPQIVLFMRDESPTLQEFLKQQSNLPVRILHERDIKLRLPKTRQEISYAVLGGILESLWPKAKGLNLLEKGYHKKLKTPFVLTGILILTILLMGILYMIAPLRVEKNRLQEIDSQIMQRKEEVRKVEALKKDMDNLNSDISTIINFKENRAPALNILSELTRILPQKTWLTRVRIAKEIVNIEGYAESATGLLPKLEASKYFRKAEFASPTFRDARQNADRFIIKMEIEGFEKIETKSIEIPEEEDLEDVEE